MSVRHQFSYWLEAKPNPNTGAAVNGIIQDAISCGILQPDGPLVGGINWEENTFTAQVPDNLGTIEEDRNLIDAVSKFASAHPDLIVTLRCLDEDDKSLCNYLKFTNGVMTSNTHARTLDPDELDAETVKAVVKYLNDRGYGYVAHMVSVHFKNLS